MPQTLILIKHARPQQDPDLSPDEWGLSEEGRTRAAELADRIAPLSPSRFISSDEPKAAQTSEILAQKLGQPHSTAPDLHEHDRSDVPQLPTPEFISSMAHFFKNPSQLVFGRESASRCLRRFQAAIDALLDQHPGETLAITSHGTTLALYLGHLSGKDPFHLWRQMQLPSFAVASMPDRKVIELVARI